MRITAGSIREAQRLTEGLMAHHHLDVIRKAMRSIRIPDDDYVAKARSEVPTFRAIVATMTKDQMRKAISAMQKLGYDVRDTNYVQLCFTVVGDGVLH